MWFTNPMYDYRPSLSFILGDWYLRYLRDFVTNLIPHLLNSVVCRIQFKFRHSWLMFTRFMALYAECSFPDITKLNFNMWFHFCHIWIIQTKIVTLTFIVTWTSLILVFCLFFCILVIVWDPQAMSICKLSLLNLPQLF